MLVAIEGISGSGKSFIIKYFIERYRNELKIIKLGGYKESTNIFSGFLNSLLMENLFFRLPWPSETFLLLSELLYNYESFKDLDDSDTIILYEHYVDSIMAYQAARAIEENISLPIEGILRYLHNLIFNINLPLIKSPDLVIHLKVTPQIARNRIKNRDNILLDAKDLKFLVTVNKAYKKYYSLFKPNSLIIIDGSQFIQKTIEEIFKFVNLNFRKQYGK